MAIILDGNIGLTYPDVTTQNTSAIIGGKLPTAKLPAGSVLQVVQFTTSSQFSTTSTSPVASGFGASITPSSTSSKILVLMNFNAGISVSATNNNYYIYRGTTPTGYRITAGYVQATAFLGTSAALCYLDSPATTSSTTYNLYASADSGTAYVRGDPNSTTSITLMEIAG
jgi:hypothetical protein